MSEPQTTSYDEVPYASDVFHYSHPDRLATMATLLGMTPAPVGRCRVLELGCGTGSNLIPMALALPESRFVGLDLSPRQVDMGLDFVRALGLGNIELKALSILDVDAGLGAFDYILCHGVWSWVPAPVRDKILAICKANLAPNGVAYISYNTFPGWHIRGMVRQMMRYHVRQFPETQDRIRQARAMLDFLIESVGDPKSLYGGILQFESDILAGTPDTYVYHEHLEGENHPVYFHQFAEQAAAHGLQYLAEAQPTLLAGKLSPTARAALDRVATDVIQAEQYFDFVRSRTFRRTLLCHAGTPLRRPPLPSAVTAMHVTGLAKSVSESPAVASAAREEFQTADGIRFSTIDPLLKATLVALFEAWPQSVAVADLSAVVAARLPRAPGGEDPPRSLGEDLLQCFMSNLVELHVSPPRFVTALSARPVASPLARLQAPNGATVTNLRHRKIELTGFERQVLALLDGTRDRAALLDTLVDAVARGDVDLEQDGQPLRDLAKVRDLMAASLEPTLHRLARSAVLVA